MRMSPKEIGELLILNYPFHYTLRECDWFTVAGTPYQLRRTWRVRLFSRPWRPWIPSITITPQIPDPAVYRVGYLLYGHPATLRALKLELEKGSSHEQRSDR